MKKEDILQLAELSMLEPSDAEVLKLQSEFEGILSYISKLDEVKVGEGTPELGEVFNVLREDTVTNEPGAFTKDLLAAAPRKEGEHVAVKKILNQNP